MVLSNNQTTSAQAQSPSVPFSAEQIRQDFPILARQVHGKPLVYLDSGASSQKPEPC